MSYSTDFYVQEDTFTFPVSHSPRGFVYPQNIKRLVELGLYLLWKSMSLHLLQQTQLPSVS